MPKTKADAADLIREMRRRLELSQEKLAQRLKVSLPTINRWEHRKTKPDAMAWHIVEQFLLGLGKDYADLHARYSPGGGPPADRGAAEGPAKQGRGRRQAKAENGASLPSANGNHQVLDVKSMETTLWKAACSIRSAKDAPKFKDYILPLVFIKRLSDVFEDEVARLTETYGDGETARAVVRAPALGRPDQGEARAGADPAHDPEMGFLLAFRPPVLRR